MYPIWPLPSIAISYFPRIPRFSCFPDLECFPLFPDCYLSLTRGSSFVAVNADSIAEESWHRVLSVLGKNVMFVCVRYHMYYDVLRQDAIIICHYRVDYRAIQRIQSACVLRVLHGSPNSLTIKRAEKVINCHCHRSCKFYVIFP